MLHTSDQSWSNSYEVLPNVFLSRQTIKVEGVFQVPSNNTRQNQKNANQLISGKFCSLLYGITLVWMHTVSNV